MDDNNRPSYSGQCSNYNDCYCINGFRRIECNINTAYPHQSWDHYIGSCMALDLCLDCHVFASRPAHCGCIRVSPWVKGTVSFHLNHPPALTTRQLLYSVLFAMPFIGIRATYSLVLMNTDLRKLVDAPIGLKTGLSFIPELIGVFTFVVVGFITRNIGDKKEEEGFGIRHGYDVGLNTRI